MVEIVGVVLLFTLILVSAVAYLFVYYYRYRWQTRWLVEENRRLKDQVYDLQQENELLRRSLVLQPGDRSQTTAPAAPRAEGANATTEAGADA